MMNFGFFVPNVKVKIIRLFSLILLLSDYFDP